MADRSESSPDSGQNRRYLATVPPQEILPIIDENFESSIPGIYVIGDVTGVPLVKIAANQGKRVVTQIASKQGRAAGDSETRSSASADPADTMLDLVIVGGGPAGLSAAIEAAKLGWKYVVLERAKVANTVQNFPPGKKVYAEPASLENQSDLECDADLDKDAFLQMIQSKIARHQLKVKEDTEVTRIQQASSNRKFVLQTSSGHEFESRQVIIAIGRQGQPRELEVLGADDSRKVTYQFHTADDYRQQKVLVVGGGNSAMEAALMLCAENQVTIAYRGEHFFRAKPENLRQIQSAIDEGRITAIFQANVTEIQERRVILDVAGQQRSIENDQVVVLIGTLPPIDFLMETGLELDGVWTRSRFVWAGLGILVGLLIYFVAKHFVLLQPMAGEGRWYLPGTSGLRPLLGVVSQVITYLLPIPWLMLLALVTLNKSLELKQRNALYVVPGASWILGLGLLLYYFNFAAPFVFTLDPQEAGEGPYYLPGWSWMYAVVPTYFGNLSGFYYLLYFSAILVFGLYWAVKINHPTLWKRNLTIIAVQWTLWWGIPTFLVVFFGTNPWTPLISRSINAWPLKMDAFEIDPSLVRPGDPEWWYIVGVVGVVWAVFLTFVVIPLFTIRFGKIYCSYVCSCGALAETVGNSFRHRGPKGDLPRGLEKFGYLFVVLASIATIGALLGYSEWMNVYNVWVGTCLAGALAVGLYPFLGQRIWCRMWCPLAFWMNFWGRWSKFKISAESGKCIDCNICNQYCQMGIDIKSRALQGKPVTLVDTPCVGCAECVMRCPMEILHIGEVPDREQPSDGSARNQGRSEYGQPQEVHQISESQSESGESR